LSSSGDPFEPRSPGLLARFGGLGATAQAMVPCVYAWAVSVAPAAFVRGAPTASKGAAVLGVLLVGLAPLLEARAPSVARIVSIWGLVTTSLVVWVLAPGAWTKPASPDPLRGVLGMLGWGLFALATASPALPRPRSAGGAGLSLSRHLKPRADSGNVDAVILAAGLLLAALPQAVGWRADVPERAVLVRLAGLSASVLIVGAASSLVVLRHTPHRTLSAGRRAKRAALPLALFGLWVAAGAVYALTLGR
jgi:hypothetical protein